MPLEAALRQLDAEVAPNNGDAADTKKRHTNCFCNLRATFRHR